MATPQDLLLSDLAAIAAECEVTISQRDEKRIHVSLPKNNQNEQELDLVTEEVEEEECEDESLETEKVNRENKGVYYICQVCAKSFESKEEVDLHLTMQECKGREKEVKEMFECGECKVLCKSMNSLASHMMVHKQKVIVVRHGFKEHLTRVGFTCTICHKVLGSKGNLVKHQIIHSGIRPYKCSFCTKDFTLKGNRDKHELTHSNRRAHQCQICLKKFTLKGNLQQHILTHSTMKFFRCYLCDKEFTLKGNLDKHIKRHASGLGSEGNGKGEPKRKRKRRAQVEDDEAAESARTIADFAVQAAREVECAEMGADTSNSSSQYSFDTAADALAETEEANDYVKGVTLDNIKTDEPSEGDKRESSDAAANDAIQNL